MTSKDLFEVLVRAAGLVFLFYAISDAMAAAMNVVGLSTRHDVTPLQEAAAAICFLVAGGVVIVIAPSFTRLVYRRDPNSN